MFDTDFITGEHKRTLDDRFRLALPPEFVQRVTNLQGEAVIIKERHGCLSLWRPAEWQERFAQRLELIKQKIKMGLLDPRHPDLQRFGRLISTRSMSVSFANRSRLLVPEGFREFLDVPAGQEVMVVGAAICVEVWQPVAWREALKDQLPLFDGLMQGIIS